MFFRLLILFVFVSIISLQACKKNNDVPASSFLTSLNLINASTDTVNFYLNGTRLNKNSNLYPAGASGYISVPFGAQNYQVKKIFNPANSIVQTLFSKSLTLDTAKAYSFFIAGETADDAFATTDVLSEPDTTDYKSFVRFVNASPGDGTFNLTIGDTVLFHDQAFKSAGDFTQIGSGPKSIKLYQTGSSNPVDTLSLPMGSRAIYTIYVKGKAGGTGTSKLGMVSMSNN